MKRFLSAIMVLTTILCLASCRKKSENAMNPITELTVTANYGDAENSGRKRPYFSAVSEREQRTDMPLLTVTCGQTSIEADIYIQRLSYMNKNGDICEALYDGIHPLQNEDNVSVLCVSKSSTASLSFEIPVNIDSIYRYSDSAWGNIDAEREYVDYKRVSDVRLEMEIEPGYIYILDASWTYAENNAGSLMYGFLVS